MVKGEQIQGIRKFSGMLIFILIAALLWLIIKLSNFYTVSVPFAIQYVDVPADQMIKNEEPELMATVTTSGFKLLNYYFIRKVNRKIDISLKEVKYKKSDTKTYYYNSRYIVEKISDFLSTNPSEIHLNEDTHYFTMSRLASKRVKIEPEMNLVFEKQYNLYGKPISVPDSITIYGSFENISKISEIRTKVITKKNVNKNIETEVKLELGEGYYSDIDEVKIYINIEKYTEAEMEVPIATPDNVKLHLYPNKAKIRYIVAMKDYAIINNLSFKALVDTSDLYISDVLPVDLVLYPNNTQIIGIEPREVEYIIVQQ